MKQLLTSITGALLLASPGLAEVRDYVQIDNMIEPGVYATTRILLNTDTGGSVRTSYIVNCPGRQLT